MFQWLIYWLGILYFPLAFYLVQWTSLIADTSGCLGTLVHIIWLSQIGKVHCRGRWGGCLIFFYLFGFLQPIIDDFEISHHSGGRAFTFWKIMFRKMVSFPPTMSIYALVYNTKYTKQVGTEDLQKISFYQNDGFFMYLAIHNEKFGKSFKFGQF